jgi:hypothetical protein
MSQRRGSRERFLLVACDPGGSNRLAVGSTCHRSIALTVLRAPSRNQLLTRHNYIRVSLTKYCAYLSVLLVTEMQEIGGR